MPVWSQYRAKQPAGGQPTRHRLCDKDGNYYRADASHQEARDRQRKLDEQHQTFDDGHHNEDGSAREFNS